MIRQTSDDLTRPRIASCVGSPARRARESGSPAEHQRDIHAADTDPGGHSDGSRSGRDQGPPAGHLVIRRLRPSRRDPPGRGRGALRGGRRQRRRTRARRGGRQRQCVARRRPALRHRDLHGLRPAPPGAGSTACRGDGLDIRSRSPMPRRCRSRTTRSTALSTFARCSHRTRSAPRRSSFGWSAQTGIGLASWTSEGFLGDLSGSWAVCAPARRSESPMAWGPRHDSPRCSALRR